MAAEAPAQAADETYSDDEEAFIDEKEASDFHVVADISGNQDGAPCSGMHAATGWQHSPHDPRMVALLSV